MARKYLFFAFMFLAAPFFVSGGDDIEKCVFCGSGAYGYCSKSPYKVHQHIGTFEHCVFCGSGAYGYCARSPYKVHMHGHGKDKCIWCGSTATGHCARSPHKVHQK